MDRKSLLHVFLPFRKYTNQLQRNQALMEKSGGLKGEATVKIPSARLDSRQSDRQPRTKDSPSEVLPKPGERSCGGRTNRRLPDFLRLENFPYDCRILDERNDLHQGETSGKSSAEGGEEPGSVEASAKRGGAQSTSACRPRWNEIEARVMPGSGRVQIESDLPGLRKQARAGPVPLL